MIFLKLKDGLLIDDNDMRLIFFTRFLTLRKTIEISQSNMLFIALCLLIYCIQFALFSHSSLCDMREYRELLMTAL